MSWPLYVGCLPSHLLKKSFLTGPKAAEDVAEAALTLQKSHDKTPEDTPNLAPGDLDEADVTAEVGSNEDIDNMGEDLLTSQHSRAIGYIGKNSEVQWLRRLHHEADDPSASRRNSGPYGPPGSSSQAHEQRINAMHQRQDKELVPLIDTRSCSFYLDEEPLDMDMAVDPYELPPYETAEHLLKCYMQTVQNSFPILSQKTFAKQFVHYYASVARGVPYKLPQKWQAMLNLVFAIGAVYSHLVQNEAVTNGMLFPRCHAPSLLTLRRKRPPDVPQQSLGFEFERSLVHYPSPKPPHGHCTLALPSFVQKTYISPVVAIAAC